MTRREALTVAIGALTSEVEHYRAQLKEAERMASKMTDSWPLDPLITKYAEAVTLREEARTVLGLFLTDSVD